MAEADMVAATRWHLRFIPSYRWRCPGSHGRGTSRYRQVSCVSFEDHWLIIVALGKFVKALVQEEPGKNLLGYASMLSWNEFAALWGKIHNVKCRFERLDRKVLENAIPGGIGEELADMFEYIGDFGYDGRDPSVVYPKDVSASTTSKYPLFLR